MKDNAARNQGVKDKTALITGREYVPDKEKSLSFRVYRDATVDYVVAASGNRTEETVDFEPEQYDRVEDIAKKLAGEEKLSGSALEFGKPEDPNCAVERELIMHQGQGEDLAFRWFQCGPVYGEIKQVNTSFDELKDLLTTKSRFVYL